MWLLWASRTFGGTGFHANANERPNERVAFLVSLALVILDFVPRDEVWNYSYVDHAIDYVGYVISRLNPCVPHDAATPHGHLPVFAPTTHITVETPKGPAGELSADMVCCAHMNGKVWLARWN